MEGTGADWREANKNPHGGKHEEPSRQTLKQQVPWRGRCARPARPLGLGSRRPVPDRRHQLRGLGERHALRHRQGEEAVRGRGHHGHGHHHVRRRRHHVAQHDGGQCAVCRDQPCGGDRRRAAGPRPQDHRRERADGLRVHVVLQEGLQIPEARRSQGRAHRLQQSALDERRADRPSPGGRQSEHERRQDGAYRRLRREPRRARDRHDRRDADDRAVMVPGTRTSITRSRWPARCCRRCPTWSA